MNTGEIIAVILLTMLFTIALALHEIISVARRTWKQKLDFFDRHPVDPNDIVMLGDSLNDLTRWEELLPGIEVKNRGISADTSKGVLRRLDDVTTGKPAAVFIMIGTNDLPWYMLRKDADILETYRQILNHFKQEPPQTRVFVQSILPRQRKFDRRIRHINSQLEKMAGEFGYTYIDLHSHFVTPDGSLRPELTNDSLHLLGVGYDIWVEQIRPYVDEVMAEVEQTSAGATRA